MQPLITILLVSGILLSFLTLSSSKEMGESDEGVYILLLEGERYYVGYSKNLDARIRSHMNGEGAGFTKVYKPLRVVEVFKGKDKAYETQMTLEYMRRYGWQNVRGGPYVQVEMKHPPQEFEEGMSCFHCRSKEHLVKDCPLLKKKMECERCFRTNHCTDECYAKFDNDGNDLEFDDEIDSGDSGDSDFYDSDSDDYEEYYDADSD